MLESEVYEINKSPVRTSKMEWRCVIHARRGWEEQMKEKKLFIAMLENTFL